MPATASQFPRYTLIQRVLHWLIAAVVLLALTTGGTIGYLGFDGLRAQFGPAGTDFIYTMHKTLGVMILGLMVLRIAARLGLGKPEYAVPLPPAQRIASRVVHNLFYVLLLVMPVLGWLATASGGYPVHFFTLELPGLIDRNRELSDTLFFWHRIVGGTLAGLIALHIAGAMYHWRVRRDGVMQRMSILR